MVSEYAHATKTRSALQPTVHLLDPASNLSCIFRKWIQFKTQKLWAKIGPLRQRHFTGKSGRPPVRWLRPYVQHETSPKLCSAHHHLLLTVAVIWVSVCFIYQQCSQANSYRNKGTEWTGNLLKSHKLLTRIKLRALLRNTFHPFIKIVFEIWSFCS